MNAKRIFVTAMVAGAVAGGATFWTFHPGSAQAGPPAQVQQLPVAQTPQQPLTQESQALPSLAPLVDSVKTAVVNVDVQVKAREQMEGMDPFEFFGGGRRRGGGGGGGQQQQLARAAGSG